MRIYQEVYSEAEKEGCTPWNKRKQRSSIVKHSHYLDTRGTTMKTNTTPPDTPHSSTSFRGSEASLSRRGDLHIHDGLVTLDTPLPPDFPSAESFAAAVSVHALETLFGRRPIHQLRSWFTPALYYSFARKVGLNSQVYQRNTPRKSTLVRRIRCYFPRARVAEAAVILYDGERLRAAAIRAEVQHEHWKVTALEIA